MAIQHNGKSFCKQMSIPLLAITKSADLRHLHIGFTVKQHLLYVIAQMTQDLRLRQSTELYKPFLMFFKKVECLVCLPLDP